MLPVAEKILPFAILASELPPSRGGKRCHLSTIVRWATVGVRGPDGRSVRLEAARLGSRWVSTREAVSRFMDALTPKFEDEPAPSTPRTPRGRQRASAKAAEQLKQVGI